jgi:hypothetical protein
MMMHGLANVKRKCAFSSERANGISESKQEGLSSKGISPSSRKV